MTVEPLEPEIMKEWKDFLEFIYKAHNISKELWKPDYYSIKLWEEYKKAEKE